MYQQISPTFHYDDAPQLYNTAPEILNRYSRQPRLRKPLHTMA